MATGKSRWYWVKDGREVGPVSWDELQSLARVGRIRAHDPVLREGNKEWQEARTARDVDEESDADAAAAAAATLLAGVTGDGRPSFGAPVDHGGGDEPVNHDGAGGTGVNRGLMVVGLLLAGLGVVGTVLSNAHAAVRGSGESFIAWAPLCLGGILIGQAVRSGRKR